MYDALGPLTVQYAYVLWIVGGAVLVFTVVQNLRAGGPRPRFPRPTATQLSTLLAWVVIAVLAYIALTRARR